MWANRIREAADQAQIKLMNDLEKEFGTTFSNWLYPLLEEQANKAVRDLIVTYEQIRYMIGPLFGSFTRFTQYLEGKGFLVSQISSKRMQILLPKNPDPRCRSTTVKQLNEIIENINKNTSKSEIANRLGKFYLENFDHKMGQVKALYLDDLKLNQATGVEIQCIIQGEQILIQDELYNAGLHMSIKEEKANKYCLSILSQQ